MAGGHYVHHRSAAKTYSGNCVPTYFQRRDRVKYPSVHTVGLVAVMVISQFILDTSAASDTANYTGSVVVKSGAFGGAPRTTSEIASAPSYTIGDTGPAGGVIFYDDEADGTDDIAEARYLEAAPTDIDVSGDLTHVWGGYGTAVGSSARGTAIGTGEANTAAIVAAYGASDPYNETGDYAARLADQYAYEGYSDWFLPSQDELDLMYKNKDVIGGFASAWYWSSSEDGADAAWSQDFGTGRQYVSNAGDTSDRVRAVRAF